MGYHKRCYYLDEAIESYKKGWSLYKDYYTGGNCADCLYLKAQKETGKEQTYYKVAAKKVREEVIRIIQQSLTEAESKELKWKYATLANCYLASGDQVKASEYEALFLQQSPEPWEIDTFKDTKLIYNQSTAKS